MPECIRIFGARQHNLRGIDVSLPRNALTVVTGLSGSGKSSLAFDTLYAEGQRRYVESLSAYARQFLDRLQKPDVDRIDGLSPAIAIEQRSAAGNPRSTVATTTEIHDYLRLLYAHAGTPHCPKCGREIRPQSAQAIANRLLEWPPEHRLVLLAPCVRGRKGEHTEAIERLRRDGFVRARVDGRIVALDEDIALERGRAHTIDAVVDRLKTGAVNPGRLMDSVELTLRLGEGLMRVLVEDDTAPDGWREELFSEHLACTECGLSFGTLEPRDFSFNSPYGACPECHGLGEVHVIGPDRLVPDPRRSLRRGAVPMLQCGPKRIGRHTMRLLECVAAHYRFSLDVPWEELPPATRRILLHGSGAEDLDFEYRHLRRLVRARRPFEGIIPLLLRRFRESESELMRERLRTLMTLETCPSCAGARLKPEVLAVTVDGLSIHAFCNLTIRQAHDRTEHPPLAGEKAAIAADLLTQIRSRLGFLRDVGLDYLTLNRQSNTLSGGEAQRIRLATQLGTALVGVLYILDEPSIGLHHRDNQRLLQTLHRLRDLGNTVIVVEHDPDTIRAADYVVDLGPGAGRHGGALVCAGTPAEITACPESLTGQFLRGTRTIPVPPQRCRGSGEVVRILGAAEHNLRQVNVGIPLGTFCCVTGVSGSGKSTLVHTVLRRALLRHLGLSTPEPGRHRAIEGASAVDRLLVIDQSPIGRTPRSNPATYTGAFDVIRAVFARLPDARVRGYRAGRFSFNVKGGRCEECRGDGVRRIEMQFLPDVYVRCEACQGRRYNRETLAVRYRGRSIADVLERTVGEACELFAAIPALKRRLGTLRDVGLDYIHLGQAATTLSGGEAQRVKLAAELAKTGRGHTLYILDEPTTGLHLADIENLLAVLLRLRDEGNTVLVIEHNLDVIKVADHIIDLGPEGGDEGGAVVATGTPEEVAACPESHTGQALRRILRR
ncbi:MAG: excinuclease ABC subunit UvrA [Lentisphaeria bacterium]|nr:excinuclease ABC subunit UvrA [Lentisphaeria bacterium]